MAAPIKINLTDGEWTCRWVNNFRYSKDKFGDGISVSCQVNYANSKGEVKNVYLPLNILYRTVIGNQLVVRGGVGSPVSNPAQRREIYQTVVTEDSLSEIASCLFYHLGLTYEQHAQALIDSPPFQELMSQLQLPSGFGFTTVHCLPNFDSSSSIQYFILPSYEVLRYFFLQGNTLPHELLSYFTGRADKGKRICQGIPELVAHPTGEPLVISHEGKRVAFLEVKEGLSKADVSCLARIAFIPEASDCLEKVREGLLLSSARPDKLPDNWYKFKSLRTILPQNRPFTIAACGREFRWEEKTYLLVDQLYDTKEEMPFDKISYIPLVDHRSKATPLNPAAHKQSPSGTKTKPAASSQLTADEPGNDRQPATLTDSVDTISLFGAKPEVVKLPKKVQSGHYHTAGLSQEESELLSLLEQGLKEAGPGRVRIDVGIPDTHDQVRNVFIALKSLPNYGCTYLDLDHDPPLFRDSYYLNHPRPGLPHAVVLGCLRPHGGPSWTNIYVVWASTIRYAFFYAPGLQPLELAILTQRYTDIFGKVGIDKESIEKAPEVYHRFNPANQGLEGLIKKMEGSLREIIDGKKARIGLR
jgi:hypothetical protein